jgi:hypothetical protein
VAVQEVRWVEDGSQPAEDYTFMALEMLIITCGQAFYVGVSGHHLRGKTFSDRMSCITPRCLWYDIIVLNVHAPTEDKSHNTKHGFHKELECVLDHLSKYHMKIC